MESESKSNPSSPQAEPLPRKSKPSRKKKLIIFVIAVGASAFATLSYMNNSADPNKWEGMRSGYKNTK